MKSIEISGKNVEEAIKEALQELNTTRDKVDIEVLDEGSKGFLGLIGAKDARIKVKLKRDYSEEINDFLGNVFDKMNMNVNIEVQEKEQNIFVNLLGENMGIIIGRRGETLDALQYLISLAINKNNEDEYKRIILDTENYRQKREETLIRLAEKMAKRVKTTRRYIKLEPMNPYERRIIHSSLQNDPYVETYSEGQEPYRKVVIDLKNKRK